MRKTAYTFLAGLLVCGALSGCAQQDTGLQAAKTWDYEEPTKIVYDCFGGDGTVMPMVGGWSAPGEAMVNGQYFPEMKNDEYFTAVKESGINLLIQGNDNAEYNDEVVERTLDYCDAYGLGYYVTDHRIFESGSFYSSTSKLAEEFKKYAQHKSFAGMHIVDEPSFSAGSLVNKSLKGFYGALEEVSLNIHPYVNLFPYQISSFKPDPLEKYPQYMKAIYTETEIPYIMYDIYPLKESGFDYEWYYTNLTMVKDAADSMGKAWIPYVSVSDEGDYIMPQEGELAWQVNQFLAFGAKGLSWFPMNTPISATEYVTEGATVAMFDWAGNKTEVYYYVKEVNKQVTAIDEYLMLANHHGIVVNGELKGSNYLLHDEIIKDGKFRELTGVSGDRASVGCFDYYGKTCLYVVNGSMYDDASVTCNFDARYAYDVTQRGQTVSVKGKKIELSLSAGEAAFIILK